jgi:nucleoid-associated protein YejK
MAALLAVKNIQTTTATITLNSDTVNKLNAYAAFTSSSADAVIGAALDYVFTTDKEFVTFSEKSKEHPQSLRVKQPKGPQKRKKAASRQSDSSSTPSIGG